jgi:hypothetical protein
MSSSIFLFWAEINVSIYLSIYLTFDKLEPEAYEKNRPDFKTIRLKIFQFLVQLYNTVYFHLKNLLCWVYYTIGIANRGDIFRVQTLVVFRKPYLVFPFREIGRRFCTKCCKKVLFLSKKNPKVGTRLYFYDASYTQSITPISLSGNTI